MVGDLSGGGGDGADVSGGAAGDDLSDSGGAVVDAEWYSLTDLYAQ